MPSPGGQVSEMAGHGVHWRQESDVGARHLVDLPEG
jgi:hypothetical protein